jgi:putative hydrolase of the HAD superfamily
MKLKDIKAVIFDLDNTILDRRKTFRRFSESLIATYFNHMDETDRLIDRIIELDQDGYKEKTAMFSELLDEFPWKRKPELNELMAYYQQHYVQNATLMDQAREVIQHLKLKYKLGLITNGKTVIQYGKIDQLGIRDEFEAILVSEEAGIKKPDPKIFEMAVEKLKVKPEDCVYIGDHPKNDIEGAGNAGMKTIWMKVNQPWTPELKMTPLYEITQLRELLGIL